MGQRAVSRLQDKRGAQVSIPTVTPTPLGEYVLDIHGDGKNVAFITVNEFWAIVERGIAILPPRTYATPSESLSDE